ncbi:MAG: sugar ABC transporter permease [Clostridiaceae bacterium]|nr:sugar ABC transporter permease [Clostridiaceae bacterium]
MSIIGIIWVILFKYFPMWGTLTAFKRYNLYKGFWASEWVGFKYFQQFFTDIYFTRLMRNTFLLGLYNIIWGFPIPIIFALLLNEVKDGPFKRISQTISYLPHFISTVVIVALMMQLLSSDGVINKLFEFLGMQKINFFMEPKFFRTLYISSGIWQSVGWNSIIYLASIAGIDPQLYDAANIDGANGLHKIIHITLPGISNTIVVLLILNIGSFLSIGFEKVYLMQNPAIYETSDIISTYVYRRGIIEANFGYATAIGLLNSVVSFILLVISNSLSKKCFDKGLY